MVRPKKPKLSKFVNIQVWVDTKIRLVRQAKNRKEGVAQYLDSLSKISK